LSKKKSEHLFGGKIWRVSCLATFMAKYTCLCEGTMSASSFSLLHKKKR
uniref:Ovule protein n=1 Tax=Haemonchus placei TaxID=6290 RepID=A0A0N4WZF2_HAEPC